MAQDASRARAFVESVDLAGTPRGLLAQDAATEASEVFNTARSQAQVVGSTLFSFAKGVDAETREAISGSALLAQLVANKRSSPTETPTEWYTIYQDVLQNVGWIVQERAWTDYTTEGAAMEVHEKIIEVLTAALGPSVAALTLIKSAVGALKAMQPDSSWLTIFNRESQQAEIGRFQIGLAEIGEEADVYVTMLACLIQAKSSITQVLLFKFRAEHAAFKASNAKLSIDRSALMEVQPAIRTKIRAYQADYVSSIKDI